jgi:hypothetical protein
MALRELLRTFCNSGMVELFCSPAAGQGWERGVLLAVERRGVGSGNLAVVARLVIISRIERSL